MTKPIYSGRLELTWTNKDKTLLAHEDGAYEWVDPADFRVSETRLLQDVTTVGQVRANGKRAAENLLIRGDALHALQSLSHLPEFADEYLGKVRLCYIDPPFNTGQAFEQYDDNLEHSVWLTMLRDRLVQMKPLLAPNGSVWVHLDDAEMHRARSVLDETFGAANFVASIIWEKSYTRENRTDISVGHDYIHVYAVNAATWKDSRNLLVPTDAQLGRYTNPDGDPRGPWKPTPAHAKAEKGRRLSQFFTVTTPSGREVDPPPGRCWLYTRDRFEQMVADKRIWFGRDGSGVPTLKKFLAEVQTGLVPLAIWPHEEVGHTGTAKNEIVTLFPDNTPFSTPKPERLMERIVHIATDPDDVVLDCFLGSGTTAAVAHKMGRRWVGIEWSAETIASFTLPRLTKVVEGEDPGGVSTIERTKGDGLPEGIQPGEARSAARVLDVMSKAGMLDGMGFEDELRRKVVKELRATDKTTTETRWSGGGGFRVVDVGPSMFHGVNGRVYLAEWATNSALAEAIAAQLGYAYEDDPPFCGSKGRTRLAVVDGLANEGVVRVLIDQLDSDQRVCVAGTAIDPEARAVLRELRPGSTMSKVPAALLDEYRQSRRDRLRLAVRLDGAEQPTPEIVDLDVRT